MNKKMKLGLIFVILIILSSPTHALSFGTHVKNNKINLLRGEDGDFEIIFFSRDDKPVKFLLSLKEYPDGFTITYPRSFELNTGSGKEYVLMENEYIETKTIKVNVDVPINTDLGEYKILLKASSVNQDKQQNTLGVGTEKTFLLKVNVVDEFSKIKQTLTNKTSETKSGVDIEAEGSEESIKTESEKEDITKIKERKEDVESKEGASPTGMLISINKKTFFWIICIISIFFISYLIYKKTHKQKEEIYVKNSK